MGSELIFAAGNRTQRTDAAGVVTQYTYDAPSRLTAKTFPADPAENVAYTYDGAGAAKADRAPSAQSIKCG